MQNLTFAAMLLVSAAALADTEIQLRVSATILPAACDAGQPTCDQDQSVVPASSSEVIARDGRILYVGERPVIVENDDLTTVLF